MTRQSPRRPPLRALFAALMTAPPVCFVLAIPWLRQQPEDLVFLLTGVTVTATLLAAFALAVLRDREIDEWHRTAGRFAVQWGWAAGASLVALLLAAPPVRDAIASVVALGAEGVEVDREAVVLAFTLGFMAVVLAQLACVVLLSAGWIWWMSRSTRED